MSKLPLSLKIDLFAAAAFLLLILMTGCASKTHIQLEQREVLGLPDPSPVTLHDTHYYVINKDNALSQLDQIEKAGNPPAIFGMTQEDFENNSKNLEALRGKLDEYKQLLLQYRTYYETRTPPE